MRRISLALLTICMATLVTETASAQSRKGIREVHKHDGFWLSFGAGGGWEDADFSFGTEGRGGAAYLRMGGTVNPRVLFGGEVLAWFNDGYGGDVNRVNVTASALLYPSLRGGLFVKGGFGVATREFSGFDRTGVAATVGTGFDFRLGGNFYVTPNVDYMVQFLDNETVGSLLITFGVTWH